MRFWPSKQQWDSWSLPSKYSFVGALSGLIGVTTAAVFFALGGSLPALLGGDHKPAPASVPLVALSLSNPGKSIVTIMGRGDCVFWLPEGVDGGAPNVSGKYQLLLDAQGRSEPDTISVRPSQMVDAYARLENAAQVAKLLEAGSTDLEFILRKAKGGILFSGEIPFTREKMLSTRWQLDLTKSRE